MPDKDGTGTEATSDAPGANDKRQRAMSKYATLAELMDAMSIKEEVNVVAMLDNDNVTIYSHGYETELLELHPTDLLEQSLAQLKIRTEHV